MPMVENTVAMRKEKALLFDRKSSVMPSVTSRRAIRPPVPQMMSSKSHEKTQATSSTASSFSIVREQRSAPSPHMSPLPQLVDGSHTASLVHVRLELTLFVHSRRGRNASSPAYCRALLHYQVVVRYMLPQLAECLANCVVVEWLADCWFHCSVMARLNHPVATVHCVRRQPWFEIVVVPRRTGSWMGVLVVDTRRV
jgi:hypothetical protein